MFSLMRKKHDFGGNVTIQFFRRSFVEKNEFHFFEGIIHEDNLFKFQCVMRAQRAKYLNRVYHHCRTHENSIMTTEKSIKNIEGYLISFLEMLSILRGMKIKPEVVPMIIGL